MYLPATYPWAKSAKPPVQVEEDCVRLYHEHIGDDLRQEAKYRAGNLTAAGKAKAVTVKWLQDKHFEDAKSDDVPPSADTNTSQKEQIPHQGTHVTESESEVIIIWLANLNKSLVAQSKLESGRLPPTEG